MKRVLTLNFNVDKREFELKVEECKVNSNNRFENGEIYRLGNFDTFARVGIRKDIDVLVDDDGMYLYNYIIHLKMSNWDNPYSLYGKLVFVGIDADMNYTPLSDEQIKYLSSNMKAAVTVLKDKQQH